MALPGPIIAHENIRAIPSLSQKTFREAASLGPFIWEFDLGLLITDPSQFISAAAFPLGTNTTAGGGPGPQTTPQPAIGPLCDVFVLHGSVGGALLQLSYAADASPCNYIAFYTSLVPVLTLTNVAGLRVTGRFLKCSLTIIGGVASSVELGFYVRNT